LVEGATVFVLLAVACEVVLSWAVLVISVTVTCTAVRVSEIWVSATAVSDKVAVPSGVTLGGMLV
jgi:hypothetical protein